MSSPRNIAPSTTEADPDRRRSLAKLTRSPLSISPNYNSGSRAGSFSNSFKNNQFLHNKSPLGDGMPREGSPGSNEVAIEDIGPEEPNPEDFSYGLQDPKLMGTAYRHVGSDPLKHEGGDISHGIYKFAKDKPRRSHSFSSLQSYERRGSSASSLNVPGGFRRNYVLSHQHGTIARQTPSVFTRNFIEFLSIYGHFAGEDLEDDDAVICHYEYNKTTMDEESALLLDTAEFNPRGTATDRKAYFLLLKAFVGTGVLFLPKAFSNGGLLFSIVVLSTFGFLSYWCYLILVLAKRAVRVSSFADIGLKLYGPWLQNLILTSIVISQIGFVAAYIVFTAENLRAFLTNVFGYQNLDIKWIIISQLVFLMPVSLVRDITKLSLSSVLANVFIFTGLIVIVYFTLFSLVFENQLTPGEGIYYLVNKDEFSLFIGVAIFAFEGIGLIIPIEESMIQPSHFPAVLAKVLATVSVIMVCIASLGYMTFGAHTRTVILLNLPQSSIFIIATQLLYSIAILLSTPLQLFPAIRLIESKIFIRKGKYSSSIKWGKNMFRWAFILIVALIALFGGKNLDKFVSFVGCFACIPLVYMYPPILHLKSCCDYKNATDPQDKNRKFWMSIVNYILTILGGLLFLYTTYDILT
ncbi:hypothetical protein PGUG_01864 [Meyerozyma guilliermondii ATCC 6260]|uniref:Amino acid transporter transmembrane domain-containing protein n=1 Tax=Meyerozyma guilliermondii (strain ATCC 6260 / CBS 566 / DSM 6381 / JCM 1539 / NBRC 10279 / NRRL Y-324) TaxID=294746 RepID=A5DF13_PICGU|nr:uncharacterized protein PGUG_01864 [Meyerozyma guilliermondii ATCC 6260]EDK37766.2 hypothetical protein PGUG_01864 [Meyerozyma guilliermondii ATCC 6260]